MGAKDKIPWGLLIAVTCLTQPSPPAQSQPTTQTPRTTQAQTENQHVGSGILDDTRRTQNDSLPPLSAEQKRSMMKANFEKAKNDAAAMAALAKELREELAKLNANLLSPEVISRAERIEKLARKIREETRGY